MLRPASFLAVTITLAAPACIIEKVCVDGYTRVSGKCVPIDGGTATDGSNDGTTCEPRPETCNGLDDDCDDSMDEAPTECSFPQGVTGCVDGACAMIGCDAGYADCSDAAGCETPTADDRTNCGGCSITCGPEQYCGLGSCVSPQVEWVIRATGAGFQSVTDIDLDDTGVAHVTGNFTSELVLDGETVAGPGEQGAVLVAVTPDGEVSWTHLLAGDMGLHRVQNSPDVVYGFGHYTGASDFSSSGESGLFVIGVTPSGDPRFGRPILGPESARGDFAIAPDGDVVVTGRSRSGVEAYGMSYIPADGSCSGFVMRLAPDLRPRWAARLDWCSAQRITVLDTGEIVIAGNLESPAMFPGHFLDATLDALVVKLSSEGDFIDLQEIDCVDAEAHANALTAFGSTLHLGLECETEVRFGENLVGGLGGAAFYLEMSSTLDFVRGQRVGNYAGPVNDIALVNASQPLLYVVGRGHLRPDFGFGTLPGAASGEDGYIVQFDLENLVAHWALAAWSNGADAVTAIDAATDTVVVAGHHADGLTLVDQTLPATDTDAFIARVRD